MAENGLVQPKDPEKETNQTIDHQDEKEETKNGGFLLSVDSSDGGNTDSSNVNGIKMADMKQNGDANPMMLLGVPRTGHRLSIMEMESARERQRVSLLKQCSAILRQGEEQKYTKESLHKTFQDEVSDCF
ncbi:unnamed protein product [Plutella xylostella]|uniref:(diamondback moth) hypothetical protein n=1 Tax=Plutella xylostella TaxID=51655 RepID=A0A8S4FUW8_PLUXY|nr:unnamed protein product [Plutella xylostella]